MISSGASPTPTPPKVGGLTAGGWTGLGNSVNLVCSLGSSIAKAVYAGQIQDIMKQDRMNALAHEDAMARGQRDMELDALQNTEEKIFMQRDLLKDVHASERELTIARGVEEQVNKQIKEKGITRKFAAVDQKGLLRKMFNGRGKYMYGNP